MVLLIRNIFLVTVFFVQGVFSDDILAKQKTEEDPEFSRYVIVRPKIYHGREKRQISMTKLKNGEHTNYLHIMLKIDGELLVLDLSLNMQLFPKGFFQKHQENGSHILYRPTKPEIDHCHYSGKLGDKPDSWAAISTCDGLSGVIFDGKEMYYMEKDTRISDASLETDHFVYKHSDFKEYNKVCGYAGDARDPDHNYSTSRVLRYKRRTMSRELVREPYNANSESKYVELLLVVDNGLYEKLGKSRNNVINRCKKIANIINGLYAPLNIFIALVGVVIWSEHDEIVVSSDSNSVLTSFLHYRIENLTPEHPNDNAQLLTQVHFDQGVIGKAVTGKICTYNNSGGINTDYSPLAGLVAATMAHEMGHNFGMKHDKTECECPDKQCIMAPSTSNIAPTHWSSCSLNNLLSSFIHGMDYCLRNKPEFLFGGPICGNGFVEPGEQCDCGLPHNCKNKCCNPSTCMLYSDAVCATGECCDITICRLKNVGTLCRSADYECDLPEYCTGQTEYCPDDTYKQDTQECGGGTAFCYNGLCRSRTGQCKLLWGETGKSSDDQCYKINTEGNLNGNCGYNRFNQSYLRCDSESVLCGMLHCKHLSEKLEFGLQSSAIFSYQYLIKKGFLITCHAAILDLETNQIDVGLTPNGAKCGVEKVYIMLNVMSFVSKQTDSFKMCVNQKCTDVLSLRKKTPSCKKGCNGRGWCNNKGHCHCMDGFAPPFCEYPGPGGSVDSGPASDPNAHQGVVIALFVIFLGVIPILALIVCYAKYKLKIEWKKRLPGRL